MSKPSLLQNRIALCGEHQSGKTSLFERLQSHEFASSYDPTPIAVYSRFLDPSSPAESPVELNVWDTTGDPSQRFLIPIYVRKADVVIVVTESLNPKDVGAVRTWLQTVQVSNVGELRPTTVVVRTKADNGVAPTEEGALQALKKRFGCEGFFVSAATGEGIDELRAKLIEYCHERRIHPPPTEVAPVGGTAGKCAC
jgi:small GTP-binding protein